MPPQLALLLCTIFILFLLRLDHKQSPDLSISLWIPTIWMFLNFSKPLGIWFQQRGGLVEGSPLDRFALTVLFFFAMVILAKRHFQWQASIRMYPWVYLIIGYMLISVAWSDIPYLSFKRWFRVTIPVVMAFVIATEPEPCAALKCLFRRIIYAIIPLSLMLIKYYPHLGVIYAHWSGMTMWQGATLHKNGLAKVCMFSIYFLGWTLMRRWRGHDKSVVWYQTYVEVFLLAMAIYLFMGPGHTLTNSSTSTAALFGGLMTSYALIFLKKRNILISPSLLIVAMLFIIVIGTVTPFIGKVPFFDISSALGRDSTLTGRTEIWEELIPFAMQKLVLGYGYGGFWTETLRYTIASNAHNGPLEVILSIGFVGHILLSIYLISCCKKAQKTLAFDYNWGCLWIVILTMTIIHNVAESSFTTFTGFFGSLSLFMLTASTSDILTHRRVKQEV